MSDQTVTPTIVIQPPPLPNHIDAKGVVEATRGVIQDSGKGFIPATDFPSTKPYEDWKEYLTTWQQRLDSSQIDPENAFEKLEEERKKLEDKFREDLQRRIDDERKRYDERTGELKDYHREDRKSLEKNRADLEDHFRTLEARRDVFEAECKNALVSYYESRLSILGKFHDDLKSELYKRIEDLEIREKTLKDEKTGLEQKYERFLDERQEWLLKREEKFDVEKGEEREMLVKLRTKVIKNEYGIEKTASQILAEKFSWGAAIGIVIICILIVVLILSCCLHGGKQHHPLPQSTAKTELHTLSTLATKTTTNERQ